MTITSLFVEIVVGGVHTLLWIGILILAFTGYQSIDFEKLLNINLAIPALALAYILGIVMDRLSDTVFMRQDLRLRDTYRERFKSEAFPSFLSMRFSILHQSKEIYEQLEYTRSRLRIARTAVLNFALTTLTLLSFTWLQAGKAVPTTSIWWIDLIIALVGGLVTFLAYRSWIGLTLNYSVSVYIAYRVILESGKDNGTRAARSGAKDAK